MIKLRIGSTERTETSPSDFDDGWVHHHIRNAVQSGEMCIRVEVDEPPINLSLATLGCPPPSGPTRRATEDEMRIFNLWDHCGLKASSPEPSGLIGFLQQLRNLL